MIVLAVDRAGDPRTGPRLHLAHSTSVVAVVLAAALAASGCGVNLPYHRSHAAASAPPARSLSAREQIDEARGRAVAAPSEAYWPYHLAALYAAADSLAPAEGALRQALARDPGYAPALALFSKLEYDAGRHEDAIRVLEAARSEARSAATDLGPELLAGLALHYDALGQNAPAREALAAIPHDGRRATNAAAASVALHGTASDSAASLAERAVREHPSSAVCQNNYGIARLRAGDPEAARRAFLEATRLDPGLAGPYYNLTILEKYYAFDDAAAARWFALYRARSNDDPDALAETLGKTGAKDLAEGREP